MTVVKIESMDNKRPLETSGPFAGLWVRTPRALRRAGYTSPDEVRADIEVAPCTPFFSIFDYSKSADAQVRAWLGLTKKSNLPCISRP